MLVGRPPYAGGTANEVMAKHLAEPAPSVHKANPQVSHAVARIIWKAMAKDRARRYQTAGQMVTDIEQILTPAPGAAGTAGPAAATPPARRKVAAWLGGAVVAAAAVVIAVAALRNDGPENGNGGPPHHTTTPGTADQKSKDEKLLAYLRDFRDEHPTEYRQVIAKYQENLLVAGDLKPQLCVHNNLFFSLSWWQPRLHHLSYFLQPQ